MIQSLKHSHMSAIYVFFAESYGLWTVWWIIYFVLNCVWSNTFSSSSIIYNVTNCSKARRLLCNVYKSRSDIPYGHSAQFHCKQSPLASLDNYIIYNVTNCSKTCRFLYHVYWPRRWQTSDPTWGRSRYLQVTITVTADPGRPSGRCRVVFSEAVDWCICFTRLLPDILWYDSPKKCLTILCAVNLWLKPVSATGANRAANTSHWTMLG